MGVLDIVGSFGAVLKVTGSSTRVDSSVFKLHYRWTATLFFIAAALVTASEFMGDPIQCIYANKAVDKPVETWCWIASTYTINTTGKVGKDDTLQGIGNNHKAERRYHAYYQWVPFVLFGMGCMFYLPHLIWKSKEGKRVHKLLQGLHRTAMFEDTNEKVEQIVKYMNASAGYNNHYFTWYLICEALNLVNVVVNMCLLDKFVGGVFWDYGLKVFSFIDMNEEERDDPMKYAFPRLTQCSFFSIGASGSKENKEVMCILPQNIMNEKIFLFFWLWMVILTTITSCWVMWRIVIVWRTVVLLQPAFRLKLVEHICNLNSDVAVAQHIELMHLGDFCLLECLSKNLDIGSFQEVLKGISKKSADGRVGSIAGQGGYIGYKNAEDD